MRGRLVLITLAAALAVAVMVPGAGASSGTSVPKRAAAQPLQVKSASLTQVALQLTWKLELTRPFAPAALAKAGRSLCLLLEHIDGDGVWGQLCVTAPRSAHAGPRIVYQPVTRAGAGATVVVDARVSRGSSRELTVTFTPTSFGLAYRSLRWQVLNTLRAPACTPPRPNRLGCRSLFPARPTLARLHTPRVVGCVPSGSVFVNHGPSDRREIALTFDDGPWYQTAQFLDILEHYQVPATFFEIGRQISSFGAGGAIERRMLDDGDMIGDHTWSHANVAGAGALAANQIQVTASAIKSATGGFTPCLFRAPFGATSPALVSEARSMGFTTIQWDIDPRDWALPGTDAIYNNVIANAHPGAIVLQHDGGGNRSQTLAALPREIQTLRSRGYRFVTVTQLFGQRLIYR